jgi:hypothetical protein
LKNWFEDFTNSVWILIGLVEVYKRCIEMMGAADSNICCKPIIFYCTAPKYADSKTLYNSQLFSDDLKGRLFDKTSMIINQFAKRASI